MEITNELKQIISKEKTHNEIIEQFKNDLKVEKDRISKCDAFVIDFSGSMSGTTYMGTPKEQEIHIFKVLELESVLNDIYSSGLFKKHKINKLEIYCADLITDSEIQILCFSNKRFIKKDNLGNILEPIIKIKEITSKFKNLSMDSISVELKEADALNNQTIFLKVNKNTASTIRDLLLSEELKLIVDTNLNLNYVQLHKELAINGNEVNKKIKI